MTHTLLAVAPARLPAVWGEVLPMVALVCDRSGGLYTPDAVRQELNDGHFQLWAIVFEDSITSIMLSHVVNYPTTRVCELLACVGHDVKHWVHYIQDIEGWAKQVGCSRVRPIAQMGWERVLAPFGYTKTHVVLEKELT